ncbi:hypothetical protein N657DRAFT_710530 [Parathielavia appendiculata]|uniref:Uncharacterized protein n=1 Tax=Parathielavia appendiculata TaxID=2587402 RepID=A0AAN6Z649_9PEZI|nr:hypothetical protein N657DRAFT_710530 [Parathielavia appendiculata]
MRNDSGVMDSGRGGWSLTTRPLLLLRMPVRSSLPRRVQHTRVTILVSGATSSIPDSFLAVKWWLFLPMRKRTRPGVQPMSVIRKGLEAGKPGSRERSAGDEKVSNVDRLSPATLLVNRLRIAGASVRAAGAVSTAGTVVVGAKIDGFAAKRAAVVDEFLILRDRHVAWYLPCHFMRSSDQSMRVDKAREKKEVRIAIKHRAAGILPRPFSFVTGTSRHLPPATPKPDRMEIIPFFKPQSLTLSRFHEFKELPPPKRKKSEEYGGLAEHNQGSATPNAYPRRPPGYGPRPGKLRKLTDRLPTASSLSCTLNCISCDSLNRSKLSRNLSVKKVYIRDRSLSGMPSLAYSWFTQSACACSNPHLPEEPNLSVKLEHAEGPSQVRRFVVDLWVSLAL